MCESARLKASATVGSSGRLTADDPSGNQSGKADFAASPDHSCEPTLQPSPPTHTEHRASDIAQRITRMHEQVAECLRLVDSSRSPEQKMLLLGMAHAWLSLAKQIEQIVARRSAADG